MINIKCPYCTSTDTKVLEKRSATTENRRRRECLKCKKRFTTYEKVELETLHIVKKDGSKEQFNRDKILQGVSRACEKRIGTQAIEKLVDAIELDIRNLHITELSSTIIGELIVRKLSDIDKVAALLFASVFRSVSDIDSLKMELDNLKVISRDEQHADTTDLLLQVSESTQGIKSDWNKKKITDALTKEVRLSKEEAENIATAVERKVFAAGIKLISVSLIRELVDNELFTRGHNKKLQKQRILGMSAYNLNRIIFSSSKENSNVVANNPEAVNLAIAENALKQYALTEIFSGEVAKAHLNAALHLHDLGYPIRVYCSAHSLEYIKKYGLELLNLSTTSSPAKHAGTLTGHLNTFLASMQAYYAGALGISYVNIMYAPLLVGLSAEQLKQEAQYLIYSCSQNAFSRGGQTLFIDFNIHLGVPAYLKNVPAIGPSGKYMLKSIDGTIEKLDEVPRDEEGALLQPDKGRILTYADFEKEAQAFARALLDVWREGDSRGQVFPFPKCDLHITEECFTDPTQNELLQYSCLIASENGSPYFVFDRDEVNLSMCCRLRTKIVDKTILNHPESLRFCGFQNVSINLPQCAYRAGKGNIDAAIKEIGKSMDLAMKAHLQKKKFIKKIMDQPGTPLWQVGMNAKDGNPYIDLEKATYIIGLVGLNECVKYLMDAELHNSDDAYKTGVKIISAMYLKVKELEKKHNLKVTLEESPAESTALRFAKVDLKEFPAAKNYIRGDKASGEIYYTNSIHLAADAEVDIVERIEKQGKFNSLIESGAITHVFLGEQKPDPEAILELVKKTWDNTNSAQICISPEFTVCNNCHKISRGFARGSAEDTPEQKKPEVANGV